MIRRTLASLLFSSIMINIFCSSSIAYIESGMVYSHRKNDRMMIALTFDDGPHPKYTPEILDILNEYGICATFFAIGENAALYPDILKRCQNEGHEIANHTYSHTDLSKNSYNNICAEVCSTEKILFENLDTRTKLLRPPGGLYGKNVIRAASELDYTLVLWNVDTKDWAHTPPDKIANKVIDCAQPGDIILMHDFIGKDSPTPDALRKMIPKLLEMGYRFVTVSELLGSG